VTTLLTPEQKLRRADKAVGDMKQDVLDAVDNGFVKVTEELQQSDEVDGAIHDRLNTLNERLRNLRADLEPSVFEPEALHGLHSTLHELRDLREEFDEADANRLDTLNEMLLGIERLRHILRDAIDEHVTGISSDKHEVVAQLEKWLPNTPQREFARLLDVHTRTLSRWSEQSGPPPRRLQLVAQLVAILRHSWTEAGVVAWFDRPNHGLGERRPVAVLDDAASERDLLMAARATRAQYGT